MMLPGQLLVQSGTRGGDELLMCMGISSASVNTQVIPVSTTSGTSCFQSCVFLKFLRIRTFEHHDFNLLDQILLITAASSVLCNECDSGSCI
jgi:hypothetical protein